MSRATLSLYGETMVLKYEGDRPAQFRIVTPPWHVNTISPNRGIINPGESIELIARLNPYDLYAPAKFQAQLKYGTETEWADGDRSFDLESNVVWCCW